MLSSVEEAFDSVDDGDVVLVSHQLPIWVTHLSVAGERLWHDPRSRRCALSSITTFERVVVPEEGPAADAASAAPAAAAPAPATTAPAAPAHRLIEVGYVEPASSLQAAASDVGAV
jgi:broad specificity phosphatase PhoE